MLLVPPQFKNLNVFGGIMENNELKVELKIVTVSLVMMALFFYLGGLQMGADSLKAKSEKISLQQKSQNDVD